MWNIFDRNYVFRSYLPFTLRSIFFIKMSIQFFTLFLGWVNSFFACWSKNMNLYLSEIIETLFPQCSGDLLRSANVCIALEDLYIKKSGLNFLFAHVLNQKSLGTIILKDSIRHYDFVCFFSKIFWYASEENTKIHCTIINTYAFSVYDFLTQCLALAVLFVRYRWPY